MTDFLKFHVSISLKIVTVENQHINHEMRKYETVVP